MTQESINYLHGKVKEMVFHHPDNQGYWINVLVKLTVLKTTIDNMAITGDISAYIDQHDFTSLVLWFQSLKSEWPSNVDPKPDEKDFYEAKPKELVFVGIETYTVKKTHHIFMPVGTTREYVNDNIEDLIANEAISKEVDYWDSGSDYELEVE